MSTKDVNDIIQMLLSLSGSELENYWIFKVDNSLFDSIDTILEPQVGDSTNTYWRYIYKCVDGKYYEYAYWEDYFGDKYAFSFREVNRVPKVEYEWK